MFVQVIQTPTINMDTLFVPNYELRASRFDKIDTTITLREIVFPVELAYNMVHLRDSSLRCQIMRNLPPNTIE